MQVIVISCGGHLLTDYFKLENYSIVGGSSQWYKRIQKSIFTLICMYYVFIYLFWQTHCLMITVAVMQYHNNCNLVRQRFILIIYSHYSASLKEVKESSYAAGGRHRFRGHEWVLLTGFFCCPSLQMIGSSLNSWLNSQQNVACPISR